MLRSLASLRALAPASSSAWSTGAVVSGARPFGFGSHRSGNDPETVEKEKDKQVKGEEPSKTPHMPGAHGWNEKLASDSEASVKADRHIDEDHSIEELQEHSENLAHEDHHGVPHPRTGAGSSTGST